MKYIDISVLSIFKLFMQWYTGHYNQTMHVKKRGFEIMEYIVH